MKLQPPGPNENAALPPVVIVLTIALLFASLFAYYAAGARYLPRGAGPDSAAHYDVARFIFENGRLAVFPDDAERLMFTPYGTTRATRPPLSYMVSAAVADRVGGDDLFHSLRLGSGLLCALAAALVFMGLWLLYERYWLALAGALLFGLLPQLAFIAAYTNDDSGAIFSATALVFSLVLIYRKGLSPGTAIVFGLSTGLVLLSKYTAWLLLPLAACALIPHLWPLRGRAVGYVAVIGACAVLGGGWWLLFNVYRYGINDPLLFNVASELIERHARLSNPEARGFASRGVGVVDLLLHNHKNFIGESFKSTVGNLDWLRLRLGWPQYLLYLGVFVMAVAYVPLRLVRQWWLYGGGTGSARRADGATFYLILLLMIAFQIAMYVRFNLYHDVQVQGKYMLPVSFPVLILFSAAWITCMQPIAARVTASEAAFKAVLVALVLAVIIGAHVHALKVYVIPYYFQSPRVFRTSDFHYLDLTRLEFLKSSANVRLKASPDGLVVESLSQDPQLLLKSKYCEWLGANSIFYAVFDAESDGHFKLYVDEGRGFSEMAAFSVHYTAGANHVILPFGTDGCRRIRLDPAAGAVQMTIERLGFASLQITDR